jgi:hypothetical protein
VGGQVIRIGEAKSCPKGKKILRTHSNGKFNDVSSADENK